MKTNLTRFVAFTNNSIRASKIVHHMEQF